MRAMAFTVVLFDIAIFGWGIKGALGAKGKIIKKPSANGQIIAVDNNHSCGDGKSGNANNHGFG